MSVLIDNRQEILPVRLTALKFRVNKILRSLSLQGKSISIVITDDKEIRTINCDYRGVDKATNVLSFSMLEGQQLPGENSMLGDVIISMETIIREAKEYEYENGEMFYFYLIHGILHLIGYDHEKDLVEKKRQEDETERLWQLIRHDL